MSHHHHGGGSRGRGGIGWGYGYPILAYPCDPLDPMCPYQFGADPTDLHERVPGFMATVGDEFKSRPGGLMVEYGNEFDSRPAGSMAPVGCDWKMKL